MSDDKTNELEQNPAPLVLGAVALREKWLTATMHIPPLTGQAMEILAKANQDGTQPPEHAFTTSFSIPPLGSLVSRNPQYLRDETRQKQAKTSMRAVAI